MLIIAKTDNFGHPRTRKIKFNMSQMYEFNIISFNICSQSRIEEEEKERLKGT